LVTPKEARKYLGKVSEVKGLAFGFALGISVSVVAQIFLLPIEVKVVGNMVELWYLGESRISISKELYGWGLPVLFLVLLGLLYYGYKHIYEIPSEAKLDFIHGTEHKRILTEILNSEFERSGKLYGYEISSTQTPEKDFKIGFKLKGRERLWVFVRDNILQLKCEIEKTVLDLADEAEEIIGRATKNALSLQSLYREELGRNVDESGFRTYVSLLNSGTSIDRIREIIRQSDEYRKKHSERVFVELERKLES